MPYKINISGIDTTFSKCIEWVTCKVDTPSTSNARTNFVGNYMNISGSIGTDEVTIDLYNWAILPVNDSNVLRNVQLTVKDANDNIIEMVTFPNAFVEFYRESYMRDKGSGKFDLQLKLKIDKNGDVGVSDSSADEKSAAESKVLESVLGNAPKGGILDKGVSEAGEGSWKKINEINQLMQDAANKKTIEILESQSKTTAGPCLSVIYDPLTGKIAYGQNFKTSATGKMQYYQRLENDADPLIKTLVSNYETKIKNGEIILSEVADYRLAAHSEIVAMDEILKNRRELGLPVDETTLSELYLQNIDLSKAYKTGEIVPKIRCEHCRYLTDGINILNHN